MRRGQKMSVSIIGVVFPLPLIWAAADKHREHSRVIHKKRQKRDVREFYCDSCSVWKSTHMWSIIRMLLLKDQTMKCLLCLLLRLRVGLPVKQTNSKPTSLDQARYMNTGWLKTELRVRGNWRCMKKKESRGGSEHTPTWVSGSDRESMVGDARSLQYEERFEQAAWREAHRAGRSYRERGSEIDGGENLREGK